MALPPRAVVLCVLTAGVELVPVVRHVERSLYMWRPVLSRKIPRSRSDSIHRQRVSLNAWRYFFDIRLYRIGFTVELIKYSTPEKSNKTM